MAGAALAMGARPIAPPIAAAANHGAMYLMVAFMVFSPGRWDAAFGYAMIIASQQTAVGNADTHFPPMPAGISPSG
ncbi:MAG TPA: hypothetical protein VN888_10110 [Mycobacterium sp.]|nr:hypothetical protein [Mycobacterium sp.]